MSLQGCVRVSPRGADCPHGGEDAGLGDATCGVATLTIAGSDTGLGAAVWGAPGAGAGRFGGEGTGPGGSSAPLTGLGRSSCLGRRPPRASTGQRWEL